MLSDPFSTTYEGARQGMGAYGQAFQQIASQYAAKKEEENKRNRNMQMLKQFGILKDEEVPLTSQEIKDFAKKQGVELKLNPELPEEQQLSTALQLAKSFGLPTPKPKMKTVFDPSAAKNIPTGVEIAGGELGYKSPSTSPTIGVYTASPSGEIKKTGEVPRGAKVIMPKTSQGALSQLGIDTEGKSIDDLRTDIQTKNPALSQYIENVASGRLPIMGRFGMAANQVSEVVSALHPEYDPTKYHAREKTRAGFAAGKEAGNIRSLNTAVQHLNEMNKIIPQLQNTSLRKGNLLKNVLATETGQPQVVRFNVMKQALSGELASIFKNSGGTDIEIQNISQSIDNTNSPEQLKAVIEQSVALMAGRLDALRAQWDSTFDLPDDPKFPVISNNSKRILNNLGMGEYASEEDMGSQVANVAGLGGVDESKVQAYMKKYPNRSREEIIKAMGR